MKIGNNVRDAVKALLGRPVKNAAYGRTELLRGVEQAGWFDVDPADWDASRALASKKPVQPIGNKRVVWLLCNFTHPYGGVFTILRIADEMQKRGWDNQIVIYDNPGFDFQPLRADILYYFPHLANASFYALQRNMEELSPSDLAIATFWPSAYHLLKMRNVAQKAYLIQDFEPSFYPAGTTYALAEQTYRMPFHRLYNTPGLYHYVETNIHPANGRAMFFTPSVDERYAFSPKALQNPIRVLFYARPATPRNAFELALAFARALKERYGFSVELVGAGESTDELRKICGDALTFAGVIPYRELPAFYATFDVMVSFMLSKHPSYLPFEAMASGCAVISNINEANDWFLHDGENCAAAQPNVTSLMNAFDRVTQPQAHARIIHNARHTIEQTNWGEQMKKAADFLDSL